MIKYIVAIACKDDCVSSLSDKAKSWLRSMGSIEIDELQYRDSFGFIG